MTENKPVLERHEQPDPASAKNSLAGRYLVFGLGKEEFAIPVLNVREITGKQEITAIPEMPAYMKGMINLRGTVLPLIDLRLKFGMPEREHSDRTCIIVVESVQASARNAIGIAVDGVAEVANLSAAEIEDVPAIGETETAAYLLALAKTTEGKVRILLDVDQILFSQELSRLQAAVCGAVAKAQA